MISVAALSLFAFLAYRIWRNSPPHILKDIRGPPSSSFWLGIDKIFYHTPVGSLDFRWIREYGLTWMAKGCLGEEVLWTVDPRALQYIFHTSGYKFCKGIVHDMNALVFTGDSILIQDSVGHKKHRKIMNPAFGPAQLRSLLPAFRRSSSRLSQKWKETIQLGEKTDSCIINVENTLSRITLDVLGEVCFDHRFGVFDNNGEDSELARAFNNLFVDLSLHPPSWNLIFKATWRYLPRSILTCLKYLPTKEYRRSSTFLKIAIQTGKVLASEMAAGKKSGEEIMSILVQSNLSEDTRFQLSDRELYSQIAVLLFAGHSTSSLSLTWLLYELSKHPEDQQRIRDEIKAARAQAETRGDDDLLPSDLNDMSFTNAVIKEGLRFHPIVPILLREAQEDCIIPLAQPIETNSGKIVQEIPILKGQSIRASVCGYHRLV
ncbi:hypothetical protein AZE42_08915 [Rhizopogon vesiculosus]|uniref:Cytochrome P450 n=1 Tax=Rhizopogon vesiculosus TaxID=180088 RepID=A0A1J8Q662_9AGAM|nr:hypothetical protein AZE42_08915 [Rhizopogon vesiculosus]